MKNYHFYLDFNNPKNKRNNKNCGNVIAVIPKLFDSNCYEAITAIFDYPNAPVTTTIVHRNYLSESTKRISEEFIKFFWHVYH